MSEHSYHGATSRYRAFLKHTDYDIYVKYLLLLLLLLLLLFLLLLAIKPFNKAYAFNSYLLCKYAIFEMQFIFYCVCVEGGGGYGGFCLFVISLLFCYFVVDLFSLFYICYAS